MRLRPLARFLPRWFKNILKKREKTIVFRSFPDEMTIERYSDLQTDPWFSRLTKEELEKGYRFCCAWDGLLIHHSHPEAMACSCLREEGYRIMTQDEWQSLSENKNASN